jgi:hypothetical protein
MSYTYEQLSDMNEPGDPKLSAMLDWDYDLTEADLYPDEDVNRTEDE